LEEVMERMNVSDTFCLCRVKGFCCLNVAPIFDTGSIHQLAKLRGMYPSLHLMMTETVPVSRDRVKINSRRWTVSKISRSL
jgi:hypothetical protein